MDYERLYCSLIEKSKSEDRNKIDGKYYEKHHIIPRCEGGTNDIDNLVLLTLREHFLAHWILVKIRPDSFGLSYALNSFCTRVGEGKISSRMYEYAKVRHIEILKKDKDRITKISKTLSTLKWMKKDDDCIRVKVSNIEKMEKDGWEIGRTYHKRAKPSDETRNKIRKSHKGKIISEKTRLIHSKNSKGRIFINKNNKDKFIKADELDSYLNDGWMLGRINFGVKSYFKVNLNGFIKKYGEAEGTKRYNNFVEKHRNRERTEAMCNSLNGFIKRHGEAEGKKRYDSYCKEHGNSLSKFIKRHGEAEGKKRYDSFIEKNRNKNKTSAG